MSAQNRISVILVIWIAGLAAAGQYGKISGVFALMPDLYPEQSAALGWTVALVGFVGLVFGVVAATLVSSFGLRRALVWSLWIGAAMSGLQALGLRFGLFLATRLIEGASHLGVVVAAPTRTAQISSNSHRGAALTLWSTFLLSLSRYWPGRGGLLRKAMAFKRSLLRMGCWWGAWRCGWGSPCGRCLLCRARRCPILGGCCVSIW